MTTEALKAGEALSAKDATAPRVTLKHLEDQMVAVYYVNAGEALRMTFEKQRPGMEMNLAQQIQGSFLTSPDNPANLLTLCIIVMKNGYTVLGKSAPASPENFDEEKGRQFSYEDAVKQLYPLEGYLLRSRLSEGW